MTTTTRITPSQLQNSLRNQADEVALVDVRTPGEFETVRIPDARNRPLDQLEQHVEELRDLCGDDRPLVLVCQSGARAEQARQKLAAAGVDNVTVLDGGVNAWRSQDGEVVEDVQRWDLERQVRLVAGSIVATSIGASFVVPEARYVAGFVGLGLVFAAVTNTCAMGMLLSKLPYNRAKGPSCDLVR